VIRFETSCRQEQSTKRFQHKELYHRNEQHQGPRHLGSHHVRILDKTAIVQRYDEYGLINVILLMVKLFFNVILPS